MNPKPSLGALVVFCAALAACSGSDGSASSLADSSADTGSSNGSGDSGGTGNSGNPQPCTDCPTRPGYVAPLCRSGDNVEIHLCKEGHHFASVFTTPAGAMVIRTHPGNDPNGWGSSLYLHSFLSNASGLAGASAVIGSVSTSGIAVGGSGPINGPGASTFGHWSWKMKFSYDASSKTVWTTDGAYSLSLNGSLASPGADLDLLRISSNYLHDVPLLHPAGSMGDTGDMKNAIASAQRTGSNAGSFGYTWIPPDRPDFYPRNTADGMTIDVAGRRNIVDTAQQDSGYQIAAAYKPGLTLTLTSHTVGLPMIFGAAYDMSKATDFAADNVGITPIILKSWEHQSVSFDITLVSAALPGDR